MKIPITTLARNAVASLRYQQAQAKQQQKPSQRQGCGDPGCEFCRWLGWREKAGQEEAKRA